MSVLFCHPTMNRLLDTSLISNIPTSIELAEQSFVKMTSVEMSGVLLRSFNSSAGKSNRISNLFPPFFFLSLSHSLSLLLSISLTLYLSYSLTRTVALILSSIRKRAQLEIFDATKQ